MLKSGVPAAIKVFKEVKPEKMGIRIDSGDISYLTKKARKMLDDAGLEDCSIVVSNSLDEYLIRDIISEGACVDSFGVGERRPHHRRARSQSSVACISCQLWKRTAG